MNDLTQILTIDSVDASLGAANKKALFQQLSTVMGRRTGFDSKLILASLNEREKLGSTGFGAGVAIPHGKLDGLPRVIGYFARLGTPIDFQAVDGLPVDLVFLLLSPSDAGADHLKALAGVSRMLRDREMVAKLRGARSKDAIFALLSGWKLWITLETIRPDLMEARIATSVLVSSLMRRAESEGGFAAVLSKGDPTAGAVLVILNEKGRKQRILERVLQPGGTYSWRDLGTQAAEDEEKFQHLLERRKRSDPDLWLIELDIPSAERFAAEMNAAD